MEVIREGFLIESGGGGGGLNRAFTVYIKFSLLFSRESV